MLKRDLNVKIKTIVSNAREDSVTLRHCKCFGWIDGGVQGNVVISGVNIEICLVILVGKVFVVVVEVAVVAGIVVTTAVCLDGGGRLTNQHIYKKSSLQFCYLHPFHYYYYYYN